MTTTDEEQEVTAEDHALDSSNKPAKRRGVIIVVAIVVIIIGLGAINWLFPVQIALPESEPTVRPGQAVAPSEEAEVIGSTGITPPLLGLATPWGVIGRDTEATSIATPVATTPTATLVANSLPPEATIQLLGPPADSSFRLDDRISFYWDWPLALEANQQFAVYLRADSNEWLLGIVENSNLGSAFRLSAVPTELVSQPAQYEWLVRLESLAEAGDARPQVLLESAARPLLLIGG